MEGLHPSVSALHRWRPLTYLVRRVREERDTEPPLPDPGPGPPPPTLLSDPVLDEGVDDDILITKRSSGLLVFNLSLTNTHCLKALFNQLLFLLVNHLLFRAR